MAILAVIPEVVYRVKSQTAPRVRTQNRFASVMSLLELLLQFQEVAVVVLLPVVGVLILLEPGGRGQFGVEEAKHA